MSRQSRKLDHIHYTLELTDGPTKAGFDDLTLIHNALPEMDYQAIDLRVPFLGYHLTHPVVINAMTGGSEDVTAVNANLAKLAAATHSAMAVGSVFSALEQEAYRESYQVIRKMNPQGIIFANLGAHATCGQARQAVELIQANALQIHLNPAQEMMMAEGDRTFCGYLRNIEKIVTALDVPVIVKEVGTGMAREQARLLSKTGIQGIDVSGTGGTNFIAIEAARSKQQPDEELLSWGIPTVISAIEVQSVLPDNLDLMISGGVRTPLDAVKSFVIGAQVVGMAAPWLRAVTAYDMQAVIEQFQFFLNAIKKYMLLVGATNCCQLHKKPVVITGRTREWLIERNISTTLFANR
jgi:isopentenyl-diphosphate Delta-isomerase